MSLLSLLLILVAIGVVLWAINSIPMDATMKKVINVVALIVVVLFLLQAFGVLDEVRSVRIPSVR